MVEERNDGMTNGPVCHESLSCTIVLRAADNHTGTITGPAVELCDAQGVVQLLPAAGRCNSGDISSFVDPAVIADKDCFSCSPVAWIFDDDMLVWMRRPD